jgi:hypothetical protein
LQRFAGEPFQPKKTRPQSIAQHHLSLNHLAKEPGSAHVFLRPLIKLAALRKEKAPISRVARRPVADVGTGKIGMAAIHRRIESNVRTSAHFGMQRRRPSKQHHCESMPVRQGIGAGISVGLIPEPPLPAKQAAKPYGDRPHFRAGMHWPRRIPRPANPSTVSTSACASKSGSVLYAMQFEKLFHPSSDPSWLRISASKFQAG